MPSPSIIPEATDDVYIVLDDFGDLGRAWCETAETKANRATLVCWLVEGQFKSPVKIVAFNTAQGWSRDVSEEIADEVRRMTDDVPASLQDFLEAH